MARIPGSLAGGRHIGNSSALGGMEDTRTQFVCQAKCDRGTRPTRAGFGKPQRSRSVRAIDPATAVMWIRHSRRRVFGSALSLTQRARAVNHRPLSLPGKTLDQVCKVDRLILPRGVSGRFSCPVDLTGPARVVYRAFGRVLCVASAQRKSEEESPGQSHTVASLVCRDSTSSGCLA